MKTTDRLQEIRTGYLATVVGTDPERDDIVQVHWDFDPHGCNVWVRRSDMKEAVRPDVVQQAIHDTNALGHGRADRAEAWMAFHFGPDWRTTLEVPR